MKLASSGLKPKAQEFLALITENPHHRPPPFERLIGDLSGAYSRRINIQHRLDDALFGDPQQVCDLLRHAAEYLERRGWQAIDIPYTRWSTGSVENAGGALH